MASEQYESSSQQRILKVLMVLFGHEVHGLAPKDLAKAAEISASEVTRDMANLRLAGLAEQMEGGRWRLTPLLPQKALAMLGEIDRAHSKLKEVQNRYTRTH